MFLTRTVTRNLRVSTVGNNASRSAFVRKMTTASDSAADSHDDFKPKRTVVDDDDVMALIQKQITDNKVMLYMKGTPSQPQCGFSLQTVRILNAVGVDFSSVNILDYPAIREGIKTYS
jgi:monothiol glutaredoxin